MAVAGQTTSAYWLQLVDGAFPPGEKTTRLWQDLPSVDDAVRRILAGERVLVAGPDVFAVKAAVLAQADADVTKSQLSSPDDIHTMLSKIKQLQEEVERLKEEAAAAEREELRLMLLADPFRVDYWPFAYNWRTVDADGSITYHKSVDSPVLVSGKWWYSECSDLHGKMNLLAQDDYRNSLRARPVEKKG